MASDKWIEDLAGKLKEHSSEVNPQMWQSISSQIGTGATSAATGLGFAKIAGIIGLAVTTIAVTYFVVNSSTNEIEKTKSIISDTTSTNEDEKTVKTNEPSLNESPAVASISSSMNKIAKVEVHKNNVNTVIENKVERIVQKEIITPIAPEPLMTIKKSSEENKVEKIIPPLKTINKDEVKTPEVNKDEEVNKELATKSSAEFKKLPNTFTPNNDGVNDFFFVETVGMQNYVLVVLDARNNVVWQTNNPNEKWDGRNLGGEKLPNGSYIYFVTAEDENGLKMNTHQRLEIQ